MSAVPSFDPLKRKTLPERVIERVAKFRPVTWSLIHIGNRVDPVLMRLSNGRLKMGIGSPTVVLHNHGAKSGKLRKTPLVYFTDGDDVVLTASNGGSDRHPAWFYNVRANPDVELWVGKRGGSYSARIASGEEKARLWPMVTRMYSGYADYQERAGDREIQMVICSPRP